MSAVKTKSKTHAPAPKQESPKKSGRKRPRGRRGGRYRRATVPGQKPEQKSVIQSSRQEGEQETEHKGEKKDEPKLEAQKVAIQKPIPKEGDQKNEESCHDFVYSIAYESESKGDHKGDYKSGRKEDHEKSKDIRYEAVPGKTHHFRNKHADMISKQKEERKKVISNKIMLKDAWKDRVIASAGFIHEVEGGSKMITKCVDHIPVYRTKKGLEPVSIDTFITIGNDLSKIEFFYLAEGDGKSLTFVHPDGHSVTYEQCLYAAQASKPPEREMMSIVDFELSIKKVEDVCKAIINIVKSCSYKAKNAHHSDNPLGFSGDRKTQSFRLCPKETFPKIKAFVDEHKKKGIIGAFPTITKSKRRQNQASESAYYNTCYSLIMIIEEIEKITDLARQVVDAGKKKGNGLVPKDCDPSTSVKMFPVQKGDSKYITNRYSQVIEIDPTPKFLVDCFISRTKKKGWIYLCDAITILKGEDDKWNLDFNARAGEREKINAEHVVRYGEFREQITSKFEKMRSDKK